MAKYVEYVITTACSYLCACQAYLILFCSPWDYSGVQKQAGNFVSLFVYFLGGLLSLQHFDCTTSFSFNTLEVFPLFNFTKNMLYNLGNNIFKIQDTCNGVKVTPLTESGDEVTLGGSYSVFLCTSGIFPSLNGSKTKAAGGVSYTEGMHVALKPELCNYSWGQENFLSIVKGRAHKSQYIRLQYV